MSRGSTLTLYRAYTHFKVPDAIVEDTIRKVIEDERQGDRCKLNTPDAELERGLPPVLQVRGAEGTYEPAKGRPAPRTVEEYRQRHFTSMFLWEKRIWCDRLLQWSFDSQFDALVLEYNLHYNRLSNSAMRIKSEEARQMLSAIEYLLGGVWDSRIEPYIGRRFINLFASGYSTVGYWKFVECRRRARRSCAFADADYVETPGASKSSRDDDECDCTEDDELVEGWLRDFAAGLRAFLESDVLPWRHETELLLVYETWG